MADDETDAFDKLHAALADVRAAIIAKWRKLLVLYIVVVSTAFILAWLGII